MNTLKNFVSLTASFFLFLVLSSNAHAEEGDTKVGVAVSAVINGSPGIGIEVSEALGAALESMLKVEVIAGSDSQNLLLPAQQSETCLGNTVCLQDAGKILGVEQLLMLIIIESAQGVKIEATWVDVANGTTALRPSISTSKSSDDMADHFLANAAVLLHGIELRPQEKNDIVVADPPDDPGTGTVVPPATGPTPETPSSGKHFTSVSTGLAIGGGVLFAASLGIGGYLWSACNSEQECSNSQMTIAHIATGMGIVGGAAIVGAGVMYLLSGSVEESAPVAFSVSSESLALSYGGSF